MASWSAVFVGDRPTLEKTSMPSNLGPVVAALLAHYPADAPVATRVVRRQKDPSMPILTALDVTGWTHAVGNFEDITITHQGVYRVTLHGNPDDFGQISIQIEPDFSQATVTES